MRYISESPEEYISQLPEDRKHVIEKLRKIIKTNLRGEYEEKIQYDMISYVVPLSKYPKGYHCREGEELGLISIASQKNHIAIYHMGIYMNKKVYDWFIEEYPKHVTTKLEMGKSCIRFKNPKTVPYDLIGELISKISVDEFIEGYEKALNKRGK